MLKTITPIILLLASIGLFFGFIDPRYKQVTEKRTNLAEYTEALDKSARLKQIRDDLRKKNKSISDTDLERLRKALPDSIDNVRLVLDINSIAALHGMKLKNIVVNQGPSADEKNNPLLVDDRAYGAMGLAFSVISNYTNFTNFLSDLEHSLRIVDISSLKVKPNKVGIYDFEIGIKTYWLKQQ